MTWQSPDTYHTAGIRLGTATSLQQAPGQPHLSAYRQVRRPSFERLLADLAAGRIDGVLVWKLDRLVRNHADFQRCWGICEEHGAMLASVHEQFDTSTPAGEFVVRMMVGMAKMESDNISLRLRSKFEELAKAGQPNWGGRRAFGLTADWRNEIPGEADAIRDAVRRLLDGESLRTIAREWQAAGTITPAGGAWGTQQLRRMLIQPRLAGFRSHHGVIVAAGVGVCASLCSRAFELGFGSPASQPAG